MLQGRFARTITSEDELSRLAGTPSAVAVRKQLSHLDDHCVGFIQRSPLLFLATASDTGACDVSPRGDGPGSVLVLDEHTLVIADRPGNRRADSLRNVLRNPHAALIFLIPGLGESLRVNGTACIVADADILERLAHAGRRPSLALAVEVEEVYLHCARALRRARLWEPGSWPDLSGMPTLAEMLADQLGDDGVTVGALDREIRHGYHHALY